MREGQGSNTLSRKGKGKNIVSMGGKGRNTFFEERKEKKYIVGVREG